MKNKLLNKLDKLKKDDRGIALLFTLGILALLLVLAVAFATNAIIERKMAGYNAEKTQANLMADSAMNRVMGMLEDAYPDSSKMFPATASAGTVVYHHIGAGHFSDTASIMNDRYITISHFGTGSDDWLHNIKISLEDSSGNDTNMFQWSGSEIPVEWDYVTIDETVGADTVVGRIAYMVIDESGKIDPNYAAPGNDNEGSNTENRPGVSVDEINLTALGLTATEATDLDTSVVGDTGWLSWDQICKSVNNIQINHSKYLFPYSEPIPEAYVDTTDSNLTEYNRFNLARTDWHSSHANTITVDGIVCTPTLYDGSDTDGYGIYWLKNWTEAGTYTSAAIRAKQIAANLIDYNDDDVTPTTDYPSTDPPTYVGHEQSPLINELRINIPNETVTKSFSSPNYNYLWGNIDIHFSPELINIYSFALNNTKLRIVYRINLTVNAGTLAEKELTEQTGTLTFSYNGIAANSYTNIATNPPAGSQNITFTGSNFNDTNSVTPNIKITTLDLKMYLMDNTEAYLLDYAYIENGTTNISTQDIHSNDVYLNYQADDPRQNHNYDDWKDNIKMGNSDQGSMGGVNNIITLTTAGKDDESSPTNLSTAWVENGVMRSPWELGAIHRGAAWETINLKSYKNMGGVSSTGGGAYSGVDGGDANILDQIKMTNAAKSYGKVNINTPYTPVLTALLKNIFAGGRYDNPDSQTWGAAISDANIATLVANILAQNGNFTDRAQVVKTTTLSNGTVVTQTTDAAQEEIIGRFINLTTVRPNYFRIIVMGQSIKDVGGGTIIKDLDQDGTAGETSANENELGADINGDGDKTDNSGIPESINCSYGSYDLYADEITGEQKIMALVYRDALTGKMHVIRYEFLED